MPHSMTLGPGAIQQSHAKPMEGGYYTNWDPFAATIEVAPVEATNPVGTQHVLIATVRDKNGKPLPNRRVEWTLVDPSAGMFVEVDESGLRASRGYKVTDRYAVTHTNNFAHTLTRGNDDPSDDIHLEAGQTWAVITSAVEGTSHVVAYAPGIYDWSKHKVFVTKNWQDFASMFPPEATNTVGTPHQLVTHVTRASDQQALSGIDVRYEIVSGPPAHFEPGGGTVATVPTGADGAAAVTLVQDQPAEGVNQIQIDAARGGAEGQQAMHLASGKTAKTWIGPKLALTKSGPETAMVGQEFSYTITMSNPSQAPATNVMLVDTLPEGLEFVSAQPAGKQDGQKISWSAGTMEAGESRQATLTVRATRTGTFEDVADLTADMNLACQARATTRVSAAALQLTKTAPAEICACDPIPYVLTVTNTGDGEARNVVIEDALPEGLKAPEGQAMRFTIGSLGPNQSQEVRFNVTAQKPGTYTNQASATADGGLTAKASAQTIVRQPVLTITKTAPERRFLGLAMTYQITVTSSGDMAAENVMLVDTLPANVTVIEADQNGQVADGKVTWNLGNLGVGESRTVNLKVQPGQTGALENVATATGRCAEATARATTVVEGIAAVMLEVVDSQDPIVIGQEEVYVITVTNQGTTNDANLTIVATLPPEEEFVRAEGPTQGTLTGNEVRFQPLPELGPKQTATFRVIVKGLKEGDVRFGVQMTSKWLKTPVDETESTHIYQP